MGSKTLAEDPWGYFDEAMGRVEYDVMEERRSLCHACDRFLHRTHQCRECWCFMDIKVRLPTSKCPLGKWGTAPLARPAEEPPAGE